MVTGFNLAAIIAAGAIAVSFGRNTLGFIRSFASVLIGKYELDATTSLAVFAYATRHMHLCSIRPSVFTSRRATIKATGRNELVAFERLGMQSVIFRSGIRFLRLTPGQWYSNDSSSPDMRGTTLWLPRLLWNSKKFITKSMDYYNTIRDNTTYTNRFNIRKIYGKNKHGLNIHMAEDGKGKVTIQTGRLGEDYLEAKHGRSLILKYSIDELCPDGNIPLDPFAVFPIPADVESAVQEIKTWHDSKDWYAAKGIPWRRGWCVYGPPGTGKTLLLRNIAQSIGMPIFVIDLASVSNEEFAAAWEEAMRETPCMVLLEDIDAVFHGRENVLGERGELTFDCLLNCINGIQSSNGIFLAITTNNIDRIDPALGIPENGKSSRPGRIDRLVHMGPMDADCRRKFASKMLEMPPTAGIIDTLVSTSDGYTAAQFSEMVQQMCIERIYATRPSNT